ncbi:threonine/serine exporter family protein [Faucicola boevrei]|uniref:threonine/serine ThrE exporter family protein n=1 Tax=Faucicola boevrei TaxID=346665 RepID=UPI000374902E|nr:threonine/serine exporter family protein [Moraxella boevrei]
MPTTIRRLPYMAYEDQQQITRLCVRCGLLLMQYGAESTVVVDLCKRLGATLGVASVECSLAFNGITITTIYNNRCITTLRASTTHVINVNMIIQIQRIVLDLERMPTANGLIDGVSPLEHAIQRFDNLDKRTYPFWLVAMMVGLSCACFAHLAGGDLVVVAMTYLSAMVGQLVRYFLTKHHFNPFVVAGTTAFCASILSSMALLAHLGNDPHIAIASSVLLLVPSFPLINSLSDMLKGYMNIGIGRFMFVVILTLSSGVGISLALILLQIHEWGIA